MASAPETIDQDQKKEIERRVSEVFFWWHSIELPHGVVTPGFKTPEIHASELASIQLPDLSGKFVLDIGAWDGFYSFAAERRGASRVVSLDHYVWSTDRRALGAYHEACKREGKELPPAHQVAEAWLPDDLPGKAGYDLARELLGSKAEPVVADFMTADLEPLGQFDVVLYLGVLYHMRHPLLALERLAQVTGDLAIIETEAMEVPGVGEHALVEFNETPHDYWWAYSEKALVGMCRAAGFREVEVLVGPPAAPRLRWSFRPPKAAAPQHYRAVLHARK